MKPVSSDLTHKREVISLKARISQLARENKSLIKQTNLWDQVLNLIQESVVALAPVKYPVYRAKDQDSSPETLGIHVTDTHYGEVVSLKATNGFNEYNIAIAVRRLEAYSEKIQDFVKNKLKGLNLHRAVIFITGDVVSGLIHDELIRTNEVGIISQSVEASHYLAQFVRDIAGIFPDVHVVCTVGNHGREKQKREAKGQDQSFDRLVYLLLKKELRDQPNITWDIPQSPYAVTQIEGQWFLSQHGNHAVGPSAFGIPWYSITRMAAKLAALFLTKGIIVQYIVMGHFHQRASIPWGARRRVILSASMKGADEYATSDLGAGDEASQTIFGVTHKIGVTWEWPINLQNVGKTPKRYTLYTE